MSSSQCVRMAVDLLFHFTYSDNHTRHSSQLVLLHITRSYNHRDKKKELTHDGSIHDDSAATVTWCTSTQIKPFYVVNT